MVGLPEEPAGTGAPGSSTRSPTPELRSAQLCAAPGWRPPHRPGGRAGPSQDAGSSSGSPSRLKHTRAQGR